MPLLGIAVDAVTPWFAPNQPALERAILQTVAYADVFGYPLTVAEVHRYLVGMAASAEEVDAALANGWLVPRWLRRTDGYFTLRGSEAAVVNRSRRATVAAHLWPPAVSYGRLIARLPFVRLVAVTGALAMDNVEPDADVDYLIVTEPDRLWLCRALIIGVVRLAALRGHRLCPNYLLSERALTLSERNLFSAHELAQMVPIANVELYRRIRRINGWSADFLPNADGPPKTLELDEPGRHRSVALAEAALRTALGRPLEGWEMHRKTRKLGRRGNGQGEVAFGPDWCKGHFEGHGQRVLAAFADRLRALETLAP